MLLFDANLVTSDLVYVTGITQKYVHVTRTINGEAYSRKGTSRGSMLGKKTVRVPISYNTFQDFNKAYRSNKFKNSTLCALHFYDNEVISINLKPRFYSSEEPWVSPFQRVFPQLVELIEQKTNPNQKIYFDGKNVFWVNDYSDLDKSLYQNRDLALQPVIYVNLFRVGLPNLNKGFSENFDSHTIVQPQPGLAIRFAPSQEGKDPIELISPVIAGYNGNRSSEQEKNIIKVMSNLDSYVANLQFTYKAGRSIGHIYGNDAIAFLNIPKTLIQNKVPSLWSISKSSRKIQATHISASCALAWIFKFMHQEKRLNVFRELAKCFKTCLTEGVTNPQELKTLFHPNKSTSDL